MKQQISGQLKRQSVFLALVGLAAATTFVSSFTAWAIEDPPNCAFSDGGLGNTSMGGINFNITQAHLGDTVALIPDLGMVPGACTAVNVTGTVYIATGPYTNFLVNATLPAGALIVCPANALCQGTPGPYKLTITPGLIGAGVTSPNGSILGFSNVVRTIENAFGTVETGTPEGQLSDFHSASLSIVSPCIGVVKLCNYPQGQSCFQAGQNVAFTGYVTNCGNIELTNVLVQDSRTGTLLDTNGFPLLLPLTLLPSQAVHFQGSFTPSQAETCAGLATNTVTVSGQDTTAIGGPNSLVTNSTSVACTICVNPCLTVTKTCTAAVVGQPQTVSGTVTNCGNVTVTNILVTDNVLGVITNITSLAPNAGFAYSRTFNASTCGTNVDFVTASGTSLCGTPVQNSATNACVVTCLPPKICVTKQVACFLGTNAQNEEVCGTFGKSATGFEVISTTGTNLPAFCYSITVSNCGPVGLINVTVVDDQFGDLTTNFFPGGLGTVFPPGGTATFVFKAELAHDLTNVVNVSGNSVATGQSVTALDTAEAHVLSAGIACNKIVTSPDDLDGNTNDNHVEFLCGSGPHLINYSVVVINTGQADLTNVVISDPELSNSCVLPGPFALPAGAITNIPLCGPIIFNCNSGSNAACGNPILGQAEGCTVLQLGGGYSVSITGPAGGILGDVCIGPNTKLSITGEEYVTGNIELDSGATLSKSGSGVIGPVIHTSLSGEISAAIATSQNAAALPCTQTFGSLQNSVTITRTATLNVICVNNIVLNTATITLFGGPSDIFVINVTGQFVLNGTSRIILAGGLTPNHVLCNIIGTGQDVAFTGGGGGVTCCNSSVDGTLIAMQRNINLSPGLVNGQLIGGRNISIVSGSSVRCPSTPCTPSVTVNTITINAEISEIQSNTFAACVHDVNGNPITVSSQCSATVECVAGSNQPPCLPVTNSISSGFNATSISTTNDIWFNANFTATGIPAAGATIFLNNATIAITSRNGNFTYAVPPAKITFSPSATCATTAFDGTEWVTTVPVSGSDEILLTALGIKVPVNLAAANVTFTGSFSADTNGISLNWKWSAAVYKTDMTQAQYNNLGVKPTHTVACLYNNSDHAGTPENVKKFVVGGARGGGGSNFTGSWSGTGTVTLCP